jgi:hypothetical protein
LTAKPRTRGGSRTFSFFWVTQDFESEYARTTSGMWRVVGKVYLCNDEGHAWSRVRKTFEDIQGGQGLSLNASVYPGHGILPIPVLQHNQSESKIYIWNLMSTSTHATRRLSAAPLVPVPAPSSMSSRLSARENPHLVRRESNLGAVARPLLEFRQRSQACSLPFLIGAGTESG